ncbi:dimethylsulfonioproprionate lyase family protein [Pseudoroseicyclus sp. CXY001]|uniref:dimethylsulfonioproprionate lyase family protein n=1 Tax=Pseudoroseicyclus sp. CXY001 TaxID=3242492 RepID=UPI00358DD1FA
MTDLAEDMARQLHLPLGLPGSGRQRYAAAMWFHGAGRLSPAALEAYRMVSPRDGDDPVPLLAGEAIPAPPERGPEAALAALRRELLALLKRCEGPGIPESRFALAAAGGPPRLAGPAGARAARVLAAELPPALAALAEAEPAAAAALAEAAPHLPWMSYDYPPGAEIGPRFPEAHAYCVLTGETGAVWPAQGLDVGLFLVAPRTFYRDHSHPAPELYLPFTGPHGWRFHPGGPMSSREAFEPVWNAPDAPHAILAGEVPLLCLYAWLADPQAPSTILPAPDWADHEG